MTQKKKNDETLTKEQRNLLEAYEKALCNVSAATKSCHLSRETFYRWKRESKLFAERANEIYEASIDFVETMLMKNIRDGKEASIFFFLKTKAKDRGYVETTEQQVSVQSAQPISINIIEDKPKEA